MFDTSPATHFHMVCSDNAEALQNATYLLGGRPWLRRCQKLLDELGASATPTRRIRDEITKIHRLLTLQYIHDMDSPEWGYFAAIDPAQPEVEQICLLVEALETASASIGLKLDRDSMFETSDDFAGER